MSLQILLEVYLTRRYDETLRFRPNPPDSSRILSATIVQQRLESRSTEARFLISTRFAKFIDPLLAAESHYGRVKVLCHEGLREALRELNSTQGYLRYYPSADYPRLRLFKRKHDASTASALTSAHTQMTNLDAL